MFISQFTCPSCGTVIQPANPVRAGREVQCYACRTTFVVTEKAEQPPPRSPAKAQYAFPSETEEIDWIEEQEGEYLPAPRRLPQRRSAGVRRRAELEGFWKAIIWGSLLVPVIGSWIIVIMSSVMYYAWRKEYPKKARSINRHGWMAWGVGLLIWCPVWIIVKNYPFGHAGPFSNQARLIGAWEGGEWKHMGRSAMEFWPDGRYRAVADMTNAFPGSQAEINGTWEIVSESGNQVKVSVVTPGGARPKVTEWIFLDDDTLALSDNREIIYHRSLR